MKTAEERLSAGAVVNGHEFTPGNTRVKTPRPRQGVRECRRCNADAVARYQAKRKAS